MFLGARLLLPLVAAIVSSHELPTDIGIIVGVLRAACAFATLPGVLTPFTQILIAVQASLILLGGIFTLGMPLTGSAWWWAPLADLTIAISLALLGPGAYSVDAHLFGRREIVLRAPGSR